jgi:hypothetical protein
VASPLSAQDKLRIQFRKNLRKGYTKNAELDPTVPPAILAVVESGENFTVRVDSTKGQRYWFSDRRLLSEDENGLNELLRYEAVIKAHWMFKDFWTDRVKALNSPEQASQFKSNHFDRLEIELPNRLVVLDGLEQSYSPVLHFFWWMTRA